MAWAGTLLVLVGALGVQAAPLPENEADRRCWLQYTRERTKVNLRDPTAVDFSNLRNGQEVASPFLVQFAVRGMGVAPAGIQLQGTGHHHILIDKTLPLAITDKLPFDAQHRHFGGGQTSTLVDLPPGRHSLRLLFADHEHRPFFVYSPELTVNVRGPRSTTPRPKVEADRFEASCARWYQDELSRPRPPDEPLHFANVRADEPLVSPFNLRLGIDGFGVCARGVGKAKTGHFVVDVYTGSPQRLVKHADLVNGATQLNVFSGQGHHLLRLRFVDDRGVDLLPPHELPVRVVGQEAI